MLRFAVFSRGAPRAGSPGRQRWRPRLPHRPQSARNRGKICEGQVNERVCLDRTLFVPQAPPPLCRLWGSLLAYAGSVQLCHQALNIRHSPLLDNPSACQTIDMKLFDSNLPSGWRDTRELTPLCSGRRDPYDDPVALGDDVLDLLIPVGERGSMAQDRTLDAIKSLPLDSIDKVTDKIRGIQFGCHSQVALTP